MILPMANERKTRVNNLGGKVGFDRNIFANKIERYFDIIKQRKKEKDLSEFHKIKEVNILVKKL